MSSEQIEIELTAEYFADELSDEALDRNGEEGSGRMCMPPQGRCRH